MGAADNESGARGAQPVDFALLLFLGLAWGASFMFIKIAVVAIGPITQAAVRVAIGAVVLALIARAQGHRLPGRDPIWLLYLAIGLTGNVIPFTLIGWGEMRIDSALAVILMAIVPLITMTLAHFFAAGERLTPARAIGLALGLAGIVALVGPRVFEGLGPQVVGALAVLGAAASYALTNIFAHRLRGRPPVVSGACTLAAAALCALPASLMFERPWTFAPDEAALTALAALTLFSTIAGNLAYFSLIGRAGPSFTSLINYLIPIIGVILGAAVLGERIGLDAGLAMALILAGIAVASGAPGRVWRRWTRKDPSAGA